MSCITRPHKTTPRNQQHHSKQAYITHRLMTVEEAIDYVVNVARKAPVPAEVHENCYQIGEQLKNRVDTGEVADESQEPTNNHQPETA